MVRDTSIEVYYKIEASGHLGAKRLEALKAVYELGSCTSAEAYDLISKNTPNWNPLAQSRARFTELCQMGCIYEDGTRPCKVSGNRSIVWRPTGNFPTKLPKVNGSTKKEKMDKIRKEICEARAALSGRLQNMDNMFDESYAPMVKALESIDKALIKF